MQNQLFIDGRFVDAMNGETLPVLNPHDGTVITRIAAASHLDVDLAVNAARRAFPAWSRAGARERGRLLGKLADAIDADRDMLAVLETADTGCPIGHTRQVDVPRTAACFRYFADMADRLDGRVVPLETGFLNYVQRAPIGVVGQIGSCHSPLMSSGWKMGPALAAGNTVVLKPSERTPLSALRLAELAAQAGIPNGVINVVPGAGDTAAQRLANHPEVGKIAFTGSEATGRRIVEASRGNLKRLQLELGGKGAAIVFDDADLDAAVQGVAWTLLHHRGHSALTGARLLLHERIADALIERFVTLAAAIRTGDPMHPETALGPLPSADHAEQFRRLVELASTRGARVLTGREARPAVAKANGFHVEPTVVFAQHHERLWRDDVCGPFVAVQRFASDQQALALVNASPRLAGTAVWTRDLARAHRVAREIRSGICWVNCDARMLPDHPFSGPGQSGHGRETGLDAMHAYSESHSVWVRAGSDAQEQAGS
jgi:acyl-CoA reductase-like NAD-dependent aldehyde dehydrogenase